MAKEKNLTAVTSVAAADFARVVTSAGASVKATFANIAKYIVETYNGSTVAGSAQSVKSALDSLNSKSMQSLQGNISNLDNIPDGVGCGYFLTSTGVSEGWFLYMKNSVSSSSKELCLIGTGPKHIYVAQYRNSSWGTPTRLV